MAEAAKGINPQITPEITEEVKGMDAEVLENAPFLASWDQIRHIVLFYTLYMMAAVLLLVLHLRVL
jgi:hypothetical protein